MISLIKNELKKIFSKTAIYVVLLITIAICITSNIMNKRVEKIDTTYSEQETEMYQSGLDIAKSNGDEAYEIECQSYIDSRKIASKYDEDSWQRYIIANKLKDKISDMLRTKDKDPESYAIYKEEYDKIMKSLENDDWKSFVQEELVDINMQLETATEGEYKEDLKNQKQVLEWRLEKNIPYGSKNINAYLQAWISSKAEIRQMEKQNYLSYDSKKMLQEHKETVEVCEYAIKNNINSNITKAGNSQLKWSLSDNANILLLDVFSDYGFFIILTVVIIAGTIVSEEFNKGTIKLLLVRPYKRTKILIAKFLTCMIMLVISIISLAIIQTIVGGIIYGFESYGEKIIMYNFNSNSIEKIATIRYLIMNAIAMLPQYILLMTLAFAISTVLTNTPMAIALPILGIFGSEIINALLYTNFEKAKFLLYFVTPNWDLSMYAFGKLPMFEGLTLGFSISICVIYFAILLGMSILTFKNRDIKNI